MLSFSEYVSFILTAMMMLYLSIKHAVTMQFQLIVRLF